jgi:hypothetical protein
MKIPSDHLLDDQVNVHVTSQRPQTTSYKVLLQHLQFETLEKKFKPSPYALQTRFKFDLDFGYPEVAFFGPFLSEIQVQGSMLRVTRCKSRIKLKRSKKIVDDGSLHSRLISTYTSLYNQLRYAAQSSRFKIKGEIRQRTPSNTWTMYLNLYLHCQTSTE